jgi:hypothetical protein
MNRRQLLATLAGGAWAAGQLPALAADPERRASRLLRRTGDAASALEDSCSRGTAPQSPNASPWSCR